MKKRRLDFLMEAGKFNSGKPLFNYQINLFQDLLKRMVNHLKWKDKATPYKAIVCERQLQ